MKKAFNLTVLVAGLGYFVDMFDLTIFGVVRINSLKAILPNASPEQILSTSVFLINMLAVGMLLGGLLWGVLGDKKGRLSVLFGSIILYSVANLLNAFATNIPTYALLRFLAGVGLAGELGAAVTLVSESLAPEIRGYGTTMIAALGLLGSVAASLSGQYLDWQTAYIIGGLMGLVLLFARFSMVDSSIFNKAKQNTHRGDLKLLFTGSRLKRYALCVLAGVPVYFTTGILFTFSPELSKEAGLVGVTAGQSLLWGMIGLTLGDVLCGLLSQFLKSRRRAILISLAFGICLMLAFLFGVGTNTKLFYIACFFLGLTCGYWAVLITLTAEQFGTNLRSTAATSVPNLIRSAVIPLNFSFLFLRGHFGSQTSAFILSAVVYSIAMFSIYILSESFGKSLDFIEEAEAKSVEQSDALLTENELSFE